MSAPHPQSPSLDQPRPRRARPKAPAAAPASPELKAKALEIHKRLCAVYDCPIPYFHSLDPVSELVSSLLSHRTKNADSGRAFKALHARFPDWEDMLEAPVAEIEAAIHGVRWPELKAPRIQEILREVKVRRGELSLDFLGEMPVEEARLWLQEISGVGPKTSAAVLSFSVLRMPALPVDSHHHRVAQRLGLIGPSIDVGPSHPILRAQLPADWSAQKLYDNHEILMLHGQKVCFHRRPACARCTLNDICPSAFEA
ncbi:endonuclease III domain-containing protein [Aureimonas leprariae]|uniref:Fe-S cluster assembly protein HesB n=1 Tax=Plantimonas leprariae TaxID=2615207 RepID=A0A7V7PK06_9HYPH|nr:Fe-S cluster assembly protein HesB [Aureimonas leprariae]KAB0675832.1 Fe-S cluster assembly protein HesB [Aureimonas leprariae]